MYIKITCSCGGILQFPPEAAGQIFQCGSCGTNISIPLNATLTDSPLNQIEPTAPVKPTAPLKPPAPPAPVFATQTADRPPMPGPQNRSRSNGCFAALVVCFLFLIFISGGIALVSYVAYSAFSSAVTQISGWAGLIEGVEELGDIDQVVAKYEAEGYTAHYGPWILTDQPVTEKTLFACQVLELSNDVKEDIAILSQAATIKGTVEGDIEFMGQALTIAKGAVVKGNIHSKLAQLITIDGTVEGKLTGGYQLLQGASRVNGGAGNPDGAMELFNKIRDRATRRPKRHVPDPNQFGTQLPDGSQLRQAIQWLGDNSFITRRKGLERLSRMKPNEGDRAKVIDMMIKLIPDENMNRTESIAVLKRWGQPQDAPRLIDILKTTGSTTAKELVPLFREWKATDQLVSLVNHSDYSVRRLIRQELQSAGTDPNKIVKQHLSDLESSPSDVRGIIGHLVTLGIPPGSLDRSEKAILIPYVSNRTVDFQGLSRWLELQIDGEDQIDLLALTPHSVNRNSLVILLLKANTEETFKKIAYFQVSALSVNVHMTEEQNRRLEPHILPFTTMSDPNRRFKAFNWLAKHGSTNSLSKLKQIASEEGLTGRRAAKAIAAIEERMKKKHN